MNENGSAKLPLTQVKETISKRYEEACLQTLQKKPGASGPEKKLLALLLSRQKEALDVLDCIRGAAEEVPVLLQKGEKTGFLRRTICRIRSHFTDMIASPVTRLAIGVLLLVGSILSALIPYVWIAPLVLSVLLLGLTVWEIIRKHLEKPAKPEYRCHLYMMSAAESSFAAKMSTHLMQDTQDILQLFDNLSLNTDNQDQMFAAEMYQNLFSAADGHEELIRPLLDRQEQILWSCGLEAVPYTPGNAGFYETEEADCPSQTIYPAICRKKDGMMIRKGFQVLETR